jgi:GNAT superfamily N-acetyltransferase
MTLTPEELGRAAERDYQTWVRAFAETPGVEISGGDTLLVRRSASPHVYLTAVFGAWLTPASADGTIAAVIADLGRDGRSFMWTVWPSDTPTGLADRLVAHGFEDEGPEPLMSAELDGVTGIDEPAPSGLEIRRARTADEIATIAAFALGEIGDEPGGDRFHATLHHLATEPSPRLALFGGWFDGELVASSGLHTGSGVAGIYAVATAEPFRGRGFGRALTAAAMAAGRDAGLTTTVLMASDLGRPVYRRLGLREVGIVRFLLWPGTTPG